MSEISKIRPGEDLNVCAIIIAQENTVSTQSGECPPVVDNTAQVPYDDPFDTVITGYTGAVLANSGAKGEMFELTSSTDHLTLANYGEQYTPDASPIVDLQNGNSTIVHRYPPSVGEFSLPSWFTSGSHYDSNFFDQFSILHRGDGYNTDLDNPVRFWQEAVENVRDAWEIENSGVDPQTYYVDPIDGDNANSGVSPALALQTIEAAIAKSDSFLIRARACWNYNSSDDFVATKSCVLDTYQPIMTGDENDNFARSHTMVGGLLPNSAMTVVAEGTPNVWTITRTNGGVLSGLFDYRKIDPDGFPDQLIQVGSIAEVSDTPGSFFRSSNSTWYIHSPDEPVIGLPSEGATHSMSLAATNRQLLPSGS